MKHVRRGIVLGAIVIVLAMAAVYSPHRDLQRAPMPTETAAACETAPVENCDPDQMAAAPSLGQRNASGAVPTLAPLRAAPGVPGGAACESSPRGQVVYVTIEAEGTARRQN
jgi:hypothetical protein